MNNNNKKMKFDFINKESIKEFITWICTSVVLFVIIEYLSRGSMSKIMIFISDCTAPAIVNLLIITSFTGISFLFKHKKAALCILSFILLVLGLINKMILAFRGMPIAFMDIYAIKDGLSIAYKFVDLKIIIIAIVTILLFVVGFIFMWKKDKENKRINGISNLIVWIITTIVLIASIGPLKARRYFYNIAWDVQQSYELNGFLYSLADSYYGYLRKEPDGYSEEAIKKIRAEVDKKEKEDKRVVKSQKDAPNILVVQLEGFMDPTKIPNIKLSMDPIPNFRKLTQQYPSGYMNVPTTGGGTARTEFEVLTGNNFDNLLSGEIPYNSIVKEKTSNSLATALKKQGFGVHAIHNFKGNFYNRNKGYENIGFETFTSVEYMNGLEHTKLRWPKDYVLTKYIKKAMDSTKSKDFVSTVSVQGHSYYPKNIVETGYPCEVKGNIGKEYINQIYYYCEQVREMDLFVKQLNEMLMERKAKTGEDTIVIYYGDHMPKLNYLYDGDEFLDRYASLYAYFATYKLPKENNKVEEAYRAGTNTLRLANVKYGPIEKIHAYLKEDKDYLKKVELVEYDILFGKKYYLKDDEKQKENKMKMGIDDIKIKNVEKQGNTIIVDGENFTESSFVYLDNKRLETKFINPNKITAKLDKDSKRKYKISVKQLGENDAELSSTDVYKMDVK